MDYEKNMSFLVIAKSSKLWKKNVEKIGLGSFNSYCLLKDTDNHNIFYCLTKYKSVHALHNFMIMATLT